jgi:hypothetical protein
MSVTPNLNLTLFINGQQDWGDAMDTNLTAVDTAHAKVLSFNKLNNATMTTPAVPVIDFNNGRLLRFPLTVTATSVTLVNTSSLIDGELTVFIEQPSGGNCAFAWPSLFQGAGDLTSTSGNLAGNTVAIQKFIYNVALGKAYASGPMITGAK